VESQSAPPNARSRDDQGYTQATAAVAPDRASFEAAVADLLDMGLVVDEATARQLLTQHGDLSTVVSMLAED